ncbi:MAG: hypothetical protein FIB00_17380 [Chloroflexi bacterium]|jgi:hypothetical protein|nr:hypothetical protein [Dehalococcoidia bacterium]MCZ7578748.1 hypothetical protein [Dehalococcoidia bacterium]NJD66984.1 hypothetical protein [Chloroflexota bacterium]PWB47827.1 MAG: hypothetical protein C3F10_02205 [Dehalococcoidia bacterium]
MKRRTLDFIFSGGGLLLAILLLILGFVMADQASFAEDYVKEQLSEQRITFAEADKLTEEETSWKEGSKCLTEYAGKLMTTGKQAECYGNFYIAMHMRRSAANAAVDGEKMGWDDETYATMGGIRSAAQAELAAAKEKGDKEAEALAQKKVDAATSLRSTFQTGETLRGLLLTSYGFSIFGEKAALAATVCYIIGGLLIILSVAGFIHAFMTPPDKVVLGGNGG